jgi:branched-subunit amino acid aminotransferase/4-amino-4-deoxychorismate lyase
MAHVLLNGQLIAGTELVLPFPNRGLAFGDGFFETLVYSDKHLHLAADHVARMQQAAAALYFTLPAPLATAGALATTLGQLAEGNNLPAARLRVQLWRSGGGRYTPPTDAAEWLATAEPFAPDDSPVAVADFAFDTQSSYSPLSFCKGPQAWRYVRAAYERQQRGLDEIILCNAAGHVAEAGAAAIFWLKEHVLYTPAIASGCVAGVRRADILRRASTLGLGCQKGLFAIQDLLAADAVFTANVAAVRIVKQVGSVAFAEPASALLAGLRG